MDKPKVYIETTVIGHLTSHLSSQTAVAGQMLVTREWWKVSRPSFDCYVSQFVIAEAMRGDSKAAHERMAVIATLPIAEASDATVVEDLASLLLSRNALPLKARVDAIHVATAAVTGMMYLLTWNCRHIANVTVRLKIEQACRESGFEPPVICMPPEHF